MRTTFIATVYNEEKTIEEFVHSIFKQSKKPDEVIIVDGGSTDQTLSLLKKHKKVTVFTKKGNRSVGRNAAIEKAKHPIIVISDAGCVLDTHFVKNITKPFDNKTTDVVAGYYTGKSETLLQEAVVPYVLVMPDQIDPKTFLPASRSMALRKSVWKDVGKFPEEYPHNEDYVFAKHLKRIGAQIVFQRSAVVKWIPPRSLKKTYVMFYRFAYGDVEAGIVRPKVLFIFLRYILFLLFAVWIFFQSQEYIWIIGLVMLLYSVWSISKNAGNVKRKGSVIYLPILQLLSDIAVLRGSMTAGIDKLRND